MTMIMMFWDSLPCELCLRAGSKSTPAGPQDNEDPVFYSGHCSIKLQSTYLPRLLKLLPAVKTWMWEECWTAERILPFLGGANCRRWSSCSPELQLLPGFGNFFSPGFKSAPKLNIPAARDGGELEGEVLLHSVGPFLSSFLHTLRCPARGKIIEYKPEYVPLLHPT